MKVALTTVTLCVALFSGLSWLAQRDSTANPHFASYGCVENTNCYEK